MSSFFLYTNYKFPRFNPRPPKRTLCRIDGIVGSLADLSFNPRPPKRTLCLEIYNGTYVKRGFNPRPPKRTLCLDSDIIVELA